jgi:ferric-dicitrate binding protein FerR (iron transport regulator)
MNYNTFNTEDFLEDKTFQSYIRKEREEDILFWENWIAQNSGNLPEFRKACKILQDIEHVYSPVESADKQKELNRLLKSIGEQEGNQDIFRQYRLEQWIRYAAILILVIGIAFLFRTFSRKNSAAENDRIAYKEVKTPKGKRLHIQLSDGTHMWVNSESTIRYPEVFKGDDRKVYLEGEAYFDVTEDKTKPFFVYAGEVRVKVLGTSFNVRSYPEDNFTEATLETGIINIERLNPESSGEEIISMVPNQKVTLYKAGYKIENTIEKKSNAEKLVKIESKNAIIATNIKTDIYTSWKDEKLIFKGEKLGKLKLRLERWYNVPIVVKSPELLEKKFTGTFENEPIQEALKALSVASELEFEIKNDTVFLMRDK